MNKILRRYDVFHGNAKVTRRQLLSGILTGSPLADAPVEGAVHEYWIQADSFSKNVALNGRDDFMGDKYSPEQTTYFAAGYRAYTRNWEEPLPGDSLIGANDGIPGPVIRAKVGDTIIIHFRNRDTAHRNPHSIHAHGLLYGQGDDGAWNTNGPDIPGSAIALGQSYTYRFTASPSSVGTWLYYDYSMPERYGGQIFRPRQVRHAFKKAPLGEPDEQYKSMAGQMGLFGLIVIEDPGATAADRENIVLLHDLYSEDIPALGQDLDCINGNCFLSNTPTFHAKVGDRVKWRVGVMGKENHVFHIHGHRWMSQGAYRDTLILGPGETGTVEYIEQSPGTWLYHCHVTEHMSGGMAGLYVVTE